MGRWTPLREFLGRQSASEIAMSFAELERLASTPLPTASEPRWWSNSPDNADVNRSWLDAGFRTDRVDPEERSLIFRRIEIAEESRWQPGDPFPLVNGRHPAYGALKDVTHLVSGVDLTEPADPEWADIAESKTL